MVSNYLCQNKLAFFRKKINLWQKMQNLARSGNPGLDCIEQRFSTFFYPGGTLEIIFMSGNPCIKKIYLQFTARQRDQ